MKLRLLRPALLLALALSGLSACGGDKQEYDIKVTFRGLQYETLKVTDLESGVKWSVEKEKDANGNKLPFPAEFVRVFPRRLEYGDPYNITVQPTDLPLHQDCVGNSGRDSAGHTAEINVLVTCVLISPDITGSITTTVTGAKLTGLTITNGSAAPFVVPDTTVQTSLYQYANITYDTTFGLIITKQPTDGKTKCTFATPAPVVAGQTLSADKLVFSGRMGDDNITLNVNCTAVTP
jgi:hypothetical protein